MSIKTRLIILSFLQFFIWGAWLISLGGYLINHLKFEGSQVGAIFGTLGIASFVMPTLVGIVADKWLSAEKLLGSLHFLGALLLVAASQFSDYQSLYFILLCTSLVYMPTIPLSYSVSYSVLEKNGFDNQTDFPKIRVWGTVGFILAMWVTDLMGFNLSNLQFLVGSVAAFVMAIYSFTLPSCSPTNKKKGSLVSLLGLDAFRLFKNPKMAVFFLFAVLLGCCLQITNAYGETFLHDFEKDYKGYFAVEHPGLLMSISQVSETLFIVTIPFFLKKFGIKKVMVISLFAWVLRFGLFIYANPSPLGMPFLIGSMIIYGMAFDFFLISGSLFVEKESPKEVRSSAQGLFMMLTNGLGAIIGGYGSGLVIDYFTCNNIKDWVSIWSTFTSYALVLAIIFPFVFHYKHQKDLHNRS